MASTGGKPWWEHGERILAPLVGGSDLSFRLLAREMGADVTFTEMCVASYYLEDRRRRAAGERLRHKRYTFEFHESDRPLVLQLAGNASQPIIALANDPLFKGHIDGVDLNCGCPQQCAYHGGFGSRLLSDPDALVQLCEEVAAAIPYPLSVKLRLLPTLDGTLDLVRRLAGAGVRAVTVHPRTPQMKGENRGVADWDVVRLVREHVPDIAVIGNGDVRTPQQLQEKKTASGVGAVMVGYGALRDPRVFGGASGLTLEDVLERYLELAGRHQNRLVAVQRHVTWLLKHRLHPVDKPALFAARSIEELVAVINELGLERSIAVPVDVSGVELPSCPESSRRGRRLKRKRDGDVKDEKKWRRKLQRADEAGMAVARGRDAETVLKKHLGTAEGSATDA